MRCRSFNPFRVLFHSIATALAHTSKSKQAAIFGWLPPRIGSDLTDIAGVFIVGLKGKVVCRVYKDWRLKSVCMRTATLGVARLKCVAPAKLLTVHFAVHAVNPEQNSRKPSSISIYIYV